MDKQENNAASMTPDFLIILVNYLQEEPVAAFVRQELYRMEDVSIGIVVVDNASGQAQVLDSLLDNPAVHVFRPGKNLGYFGGAAYGLRQYQQQFQRELPPFVVLSNTDLQFPSPLFFKRIKEKYPDTSWDVWGPDIISRLTGQHQNPYIPARIPEAKLKFFRLITSNAALYNVFLFFYYLKEKALGKISVRGQLHAQAGFYYSLHGSFLLFSRRYFQRGGHLDYGSFLFGEEIFIGELARKKHLEVFYDLEFQIYHDEHASTGIFKSAQVVSYMHQAYQHLLEHYYHID